MKIGGSAVRDWTVLYYLNGTNDLEPKLVRNLLDAETVGSTDSVQLVAQLARAPQKVVHGRQKDARKTNLDGDWTGTRRYLLTSAEAKKGGQKKRIASEVVQELPLIDAGSPAGLQEFLKWGMRNYPARHTMVVIGDHGKGFVGTGYDYAHKSQLDLGELQSALDGSGLKPDLLVFDACLMGQLEVASQLQGRAGIMVASEEIVGQDGLPHQAIAEFLVGSPRSTPREVAQAIVSLAGDDELERLDNDRPDAAVQLAAIRLDRIGAVQQATDGLARAMETSGVDPARVAGPRRESKRFGADCGQKPEEDFRDLGHFASLLQADTSLPASVLTAAQAVSASLKKAVLAQTHEGEDMEDTQGLSVYLPSRLGPEGKARHGVGPGNQWNYRQTDFAKQTRWDEWLSA